DRDRRFPSIVGFADALAAAASGKEAAAPRTGPPATDGGPSPTDPAEPPPARGRVTATMDRHRPAPAPHPSPNAATTTSGRSSGELLPGRKHGVRAGLVALLATVAI